MRRVGVLTVFLLLVSWRVNAEDLIGASVLKPWQPTDVPYKITPDLRAKVNLNFGADTVPFTGKPSEILTIFQGTYTVLRPQNAYKYIGSTGAFPCLNVALLDENETTITLGHLDAPTDHVKTVEAMVALFNNTRPTHAFLSSDMGPDDFRLVQVLNTLLENNITDIRFMKSNAMIIGRGGKVSTNYFQVDDSAKLDYPSRVGLSVLPGANCTFIRGVVLSGRPLSGCP